jgi:hypothetical protein
VLPKLSSLSLLSLLDSHSKLVNVDRVNRVPVLLFPLLPPVVASLKQTTLSVQRYNRTQHKVSTKCTLTHGEPYPCPSSPAD